MKCILCEGHSHSFYTHPKMQSEYFHCQTCQLRFLNPLHRYSPEKEQARYLLHNNDSGDEGYQNFVKPLVQVVLDKIPKDAIGLDFGCGADSSVTHLLNKAGYQNITLYDPYFYPDSPFAKQMYDFILATEVMEHVYEPAIEFSKLRNLLKTGSSLGVMTSLVKAETDFAHWQYKNDPTHVTFYSKATFHWIKEKYHFSTCTFIDDRTIWLTV